MSNPSAKKKILVVDDDGNLRMLYKMVLEDEGYEVLDASGGEEALLLTRSREPDIILLDILMPDMDGIEVMREIMSINKNIPVVLNTAREDFSSHFVSWQASAFLVKSSDLEPLKQTIKDLLKSSSHATSDDNNAG